MLSVLLLIALACTSSEGASQNTSDPTVQQNIVNVHNSIRRAIPTTSTFQISWDTQAASIAQQWADKCVFRHPSSTEVTQYLTTPSFRCGQNIAMGSGSSMSWNDSISLWSKEVSDFIFGQNTGKIVGHYTQIVWNTTFQIGCGFKICNITASNPTGTSFFVCDYCPAGNITPNQFSPYLAGTACAKCPNNCNNGLCTNPCPVTNYYSNCDTGLFPNGCNNAPTYMEPFKPSCNATCQCKGTLLY